MFYIMDMVEGRILWDVTLSDYAKEDRWPIFEAQVKTIAQLHSLDYEAIGLGDYGKPGNYFERQIGRWTKQYIASETRKSTIWISSWRGCRGKFRRMTRPQLFMVILGLIIWSCIRRNQRLALCWIGNCRRWGIPWRFHLSFDAMAHAVD